MLKLIPGTLHVNPLSDYGAVEVGEHRFFQLLPGKPQKLVEVSLSAAKASDLDRGGGVLCGARGAVLLLLRAAACELELREQDAGVCCSGERGGAQVSLCSAPFTDWWRAYALTPSCATTRAGTKPRQTRTG